MEKIGNILSHGTKEIFLRWLEMMAWRGTCALSDMDIAKKALPEVLDMLRGSLRKNHGDTVGAHMAIKSLRIAASVDGRMDATKFFFEDLEECLRHRRRGITAACLVIRATMRGQGKISLPRTPSAMRLSHFRDVASRASSEERLAA
jgi:hypothetical protein